jgi:hypothetical protein
MAQAPQVVGQFDFSIPVTVAGRALNGEQR